MSRRVLLVDNFDSFTYNIYQLFASLGVSVDVLRNDAVSVPLVQQCGYSHIIIGPGPKGPEASGASLELIDTFKETLPILGICLGMQAIGLLFGAVVAPETPLHGKKDSIRHRGTGIHRGIPSPFKAARYNSLYVRSIDTSKLEITAENSEGRIMGLRHKNHRFLEGIQYHPESFMSQYGETLADNFLGMRYE